MQLKKRKIVKTNKILGAIVFLIACSLPTMAQTISETAGTTTTITITGGEVFADPNDGTNGGLGGDCSKLFSSTNLSPLENYPNCNCITLTTLTAPAGQQVSVTFSQFRVGGAFDWLAIFDGSAVVTATNGSGSANNPTSSDPILWNSTVDGDELSDMLLEGSITFTSTNGSLTFASRFSGIVNTCGWEADVALCTGNSCPQPLGPAVSAAFVTTWEVDASDVITIPLQNGTYNFDYAWEHLSDTANISGTHTNADGNFTTNFVEAGTYRLSITGQFPHLKDYPVSKLLDVLQWSEILWGNMERMFFNWQGTGFTATDAPDLSQATNMRKMFSGASNFNENLNHWDVSNITNMAEIFRSATTFNGDITTWDVSNVTFFFRAFENAQSFNQNISGWDVSGAGNMEEMFDGAIAFNQPIGIWDVSNVGNFFRMLANCQVFDQALGNWKFKPNANFSQFSAGSNSMSCENYSSTILGWNFNNPNIDNLSISGFNADYDAVASRARDELIARGWSMSAGTDIGGDCGTEYQFACQDSLLLGPDSLFGILILEASQHISLDSIVVDTVSDVNCTAGESIILGVGFETILGNAFIAQIDDVDCTPPPSDSVVVNLISNHDITFIEEVTQEVLDHHESNSNKTTVDALSLLERELSFQMFPDPFTHETQLHFYLPENQEVSIQLIDHMGRLIQTILPAQQRAAGVHQIGFTYNARLHGLFSIVIQTPQKRVVEKIMIKSY